VDRKQKNRLFNLAGVVVIVFWLILMGLLVKKTHFQGSPAEQGEPTTRTSAIDSSQREWMEIFLKGKKVGYSVNQVSPVGDEHYLIHEEIFLRLHLMDQLSGIHAVTRAVVGADFTLRNFRFTMRSGLVTFRVSGRVEGRDLLLDVGEDRARRTERIPLKRPPVIASGMAQFFKGQPIEVGQSFEFPLFDPSTMSQKQVVVKVAARESVIIHRMEFDAFRLEAEMWGQSLIFWVDETGTVLKEKGFMGLTLVKSSAARAPRDIEGREGEDFYELAAIPVKQKLRHPDRLSYLKVKMEGLDDTPFDTAVLNQGRQHFEGETLVITREKVPEKASYTLPYSEPPEKLTPFLQPEFNIESDDKAMAERVSAIAGQEKKPAIVARRLMAWVYKEVEKRPVISVPSAKEVLKVKQGDCNEHAVLLTALLRASGIPARVCVGLVYSKGRFFYHAWTECFLGEWVSMDGTLDQMPADVTHIKLVQGGLDRQVDIIALIGKLKMEILDFGP